MSCTDYQCKKVWLIAAVLTLLLGGCATHHSDNGQYSASERVWNPTWSHATISDEQRALLQFAPAIVIGDDWASWNRPGTAAITHAHTGKDTVTIDPTRATMYSERRAFTSAGGRDLTNYIYRVHFDRVPVRFKPFHITAGPNGGILMVVTVDEDQTPLIYTLVHTCGCYIAMIPTTALPSTLRPVDWPAKTQTVFDIPLPAEIDAHQGRLLLHVAGGEHRMIGLAPLPKNNRWLPQTLRLRPTSDLESLQDANGTAQSFYINEGRSKGWVRDTHKPFEKWLISWWAFDPRVGVDKRYGQPGDDAPSFYTSLKPWARDASDMRYFDRFLTYWGWRL